MPRLISTRSQFPNLQSVQRTTHLISSFQGFNRSFAADEVTPGEYPVTLITITTTRRFSRISPTACRGSTPALSAQSGLAGRQSKIACFWNDRPAGQLSVRRRMLSVQKHDAFVSCVTAPGKGPGTSVEGHETTGDRVWTSSSKEEPELPNHPWPAPGCVSLPTPVDSSKGERALTLAKKKTRLATHPVALVGGASGATGRGRPRTAQPVSGPDIIGI